MFSGTLAMWANKTRPKDDEFFFKKRGARLAKHHLGDYGMDWVYNDAFHHKGKPRWKTLTPVLEYALGCFCFETYLFEEAAKHFQKLTKDKTYGESAKALGARANLEAEALAEYVELCNALDTVDNPAKLQQLRQQLQTFDNRRKGTIFLLDVLPLNQEVRNDFFGENEVRIPKAPPEPLWAER